VQHQAWCHWGGQYVRGGCEEVHVGLVFFSPLCLQSTYCIIIKPKKLDWTHLDHSLSVREQS
jgi:hypothetical protein